MTEFLQSATNNVDNEPDDLFDYTKEEINDFRPAEGKLKNKIPRFIESRKIKLQEARLKELVANSDAHIIFEEDPLFIFMRMCHGEMVSYLPFL